MQKLLVLLFFHFEAFRFYFKCIGKSLENFKQRNGIFSFFIEAYLIYNVTLASVVQQSDKHTHTHMFFCRFFSLITKY